MKAGFRILACTLFCSTLLAQSNNPVPFVNQPLVPTSVVPGSAGFTLTINGAGFVPSSIVNWNGSPRTTVVLSATSLQATINASDISRATTAWVTVVNPSPGGGTSSVAYFFARNAAPSVAMGFDPNFSTPGPNVIGDFNNDRQLDIAVVSTSNRQLVIDMYPGIGKGQFGSPIETTISNSIEASHALGGDFNGDGNLDLPVNDGRQIEILLGDGKGGFSAKPHFSSLCDSWATGDFNGDGKLDLITIGGSPARIGIWSGNGDGTFQSSQTIRLNDTVPDFNGFAVGDFNGDSALDFAISRKNSVQVFLNDGHGTFQLLANYIVAYPGPAATQM